MPELELLDYGGGNLGSVRRCLERLGWSFVMVEVPSGSRPLILPGVGAFGAVMAGLAGLRERLRDLLRGGTPYLGICVGLQILLESSQESPGVAGLGLIPGEVVRYQAPKVPQMGWNDLRACQPGWPDGFVYFVNSFYARPTDSGAVLYEADYHGRFCAALRSQNLTAFQFHPEKSGELGEQLLRRWKEQL
ncbi:MAG: imidazole glycerol phosphate synthase subunit HisH [Vulcanimicrobiota bacterium]